MIKSRIHLSIVIPAYNEEKRISKTLDTIVEWRSNNDEFEIELIVSDDGSIDNTREIIKNYMNIYSWIRLVKNKHIGMMNAIISGVNQAKHSFIGTLEADGSCHPREFNKFVRFLDDYDFIVGSRYMGRVQGKSFFRRILSKGMSTMFNLLFAFKLLDPQVSFRMYKKVVIKSVLPKLRLNHDGLKCSEIAVKAYGLGYDIVEVPIEYSHNSDSRAVPSGLKGLYVVAGATLALVYLWIQTHHEYQAGMFKRNPLRLGFPLA
jgi:glycosyltransferase involved in cell wall biosynthesis